MNAKKPHADVPNLIPLKYRFSLPDFCQITGLGRSATYDRIANGRLRVVKDGRRVFITRAELIRYLEACESSSVVTLP